MELNKLTPGDGKIGRGKRKARGQGSGKGGTSTRGHKGAKQRAGFSNKRNYEGGQTPLQMRFPKRGFKNPFRVEYAVFNLTRLEEIADKYQATTISPDFLVENGLVGKKDLVKILAKGSLSKKLDITAHKFSNAAKEAIESAGGTTTVL
jgi:large subunit ribosomal protein L15